jgi:hypothetical protein
VTYRLLFAAIMLLTAASVVCGCGEDPASWEEQDPPPTVECFADGWLCTLNDLTRPRQGWFSTIGSCADTRDCDPTTCNRKVTCIEGN